MRQFRLDILIKPPYLWFIESWGPLGPVVYGEKNVSCICCIIFAPPHSSLRETCGFKRSSVFRQSQHKDHAMGRPSHSRVPLISPFLHPFTPAPFLVNLWSHTWIIIVILLFVGVQAAEWGSSAWRLGDPLHKRRCALLCGSQHSHHNVQWPKNRKVLCVSTCPLWHVYTWHDFIVNVVVLRGKG